MNTTTPPRRGRKPAHGDAAGLKHRAQARFDGAGFDVLLGLSDGFAISGWVRCALRVGLDMPLHGTPNRDADGRGLFTEPVVQVVLAEAERAALVERFPDRLDRAAFIVAVATDARIAATIRNHIAAVERGAEVIALPLTTTSERAARGAA